LIGGRELSLLTYTRSQRRGLEVADRPYDVYKNGIDQAITDNGQYDVYWALK